MANKAFGVPGTDTNTVVKAQVRTPQGEVQNRLPRVPLEGDTQRVFEIGDGEIIESVSTGTPVGELVEVPFVGGQEFS